MPRRITRECAELVITHGNSHKDAAAAMNVGLSSIQRCNASIKFITTWMQLMVSVGCYLN
ncbi:TPA: hypothetical protein ACX6R1_002120 [Photobacterium damselae]